MKTLHVYVTRQMLATLLMTVFVFTLVLLLGNVIKEILNLVIQRRATLWVAAQAIGLLIPYVLAFSLPIGMLTASLLVFGRLSVDQELTAARASGISLLSLISPILVLSVLVSCFCVWLNCQIAPASRIAYKELLYKVGMDRPSSVLQSGQTFPFADYAVWVGKVMDDGTNLENVIVEHYDTNGALDQLIKSPTGTITPFLDKSHVVLALQDETSMDHSEKGWLPAPEGGGTFTIRVQTNMSQAIDVPISDMTYHQLVQRREEVEKERSAPAPRNLTRKQLVQYQKDLRETASEKSAPILFYIQKAAAFSFACIGFTLVGIPLGIRGHRRETSAGIAIALLLMLGYYSFVVLAQGWADHPERFPYLIVWLPNFIFQAVGAVLLWRANRGV